MLFSIPELGSHTATIIRPKITLNSLEAPQREEGQIAEQRNKKDNMTCFWEQILSQPVQISLARQVPILGLLAVM